MRQIQASPLEHLHRGLEVWRFVRDPAPWHATILTVYERYMDLGLFDLRHLMAMTVIC